MRALPFALAVATAVYTTALVGCTIEVAGDEGRTCQTAFDCPDNLTCVQARSGAGKTCEALAAPPIGNFATDAGVAFYCDGAKPVLDTYCISCHTIPPAGGAPATFRLDTYDSDGGVPGAKAEAERVYVRAVVTKDMPPGLPIPAADQQILTAWFRSGAPFCEDGGVDAGP